MSTTITDPEVEREHLRRDLADRLDLPPEELPDDRPLFDRGGFDSLAMMTILTWLDDRGIAVDRTSSGVTTVGGALDLQPPGPGSFADAMLVTGLRGGGAVPPGLRAAVEFTLPGSRQRTDPLMPPTRNGRHLLTPVRPEDTSFLYELATRPETSYRWRYRGVAPAVESFVEGLWDGVLTQQIVRAGDTDEPVGHVVAYHPDRQLGHAYLGAVFTATETGRGTAALAVKLFVDFLFHVYPLRKIYLEIPGFNWPAMSSAEGRLFHVEGVLREHDHFAGRYWDQRLCAIYRDGRPSGRPDA